MDERERLAQLVARLQSGDRSTFNEIYKLTSPKAFFVAFEITKNNQDAEDILQESYITALDKISTLDKPESFVGWFHRIVANKAKDSLKKKKPTLFDCDENDAFEVIPDEDTDFMPEASVDKSELHKIVMSVLDELSEEKRACVLMYYFEECSVNDIAETLDVPVSTVKNRLFTARKDLQGKFSKRGITSAYSVAPIGVVLWALRRSSDSVAKAFIQGSAPERVLASILASGSGGAAAAGATATGATAAATAGTGIASKVAAMTVVQKIIAGTVAAAVVTGSGFGVAAVVKNRNAQQEAERERITGKTSVTEEVTTAFYTEPETAMQAVVEVTTQASTETLSVSSSAGTSATQKTTGTTAKPTTTKPVTTKPTTTKPVTTKPTTTRPATIKPTTTRAATTRPTTTRATTTRPTTTRPTTTKATTAAPATVVIDLYDGTGEIVATLTKSVPTGTEMSRLYIISLIEGDGYEPNAGVYDDGGVAFGTVAQSGQSYKFSADL